MICDMCGNVINRFKPLNLEERQEVLEIVRVELSNIEFHKKNRLEGIKKAQEYWYKNRGYRTVPYVIDEYSKLLIEQIEMLPDCAEREWAVGKVKDSLHLCEVVIKSFGLSC